MMMLVELLSMSQRIFLALVAQSYSRWLRNAISKVLFSFLCMHRHIASSPFMQSLHRQTLASESPEMFELAQDYHDQV